MTNSKIDILAINDTKLDSSIRDSEISLPVFEVVRRDCPVNGRYSGGVCIYFQNNINYHERHDLSDNQLECLVIEITRPHSRPFLVSTWYRPPSSSQDIFNRFEILVDKIDSENNDFYLLGDLNCDMLQAALCETHHKLHLAMYWIAKEEISNTKFTSLLALLQ